MPTGRGHASRSRSSSAPVSSAAAAQPARTPRPAHGPMGRPSRAGGGLDGDAGAHRPAPCGRDDLMTEIGVVFRPQLPPERLRSVARAADEAGLDELWLWG